MSRSFSNLVEICERSCADYAGKPLFGTKKAGQWSWITYGDFKAMVDSFRAGLAAIGVGKGDRVAIISNNRVEWAVACYATYGLEAAFVPMYEAQHDKEWQFILEDCAAKVCIAATNAIDAKVVKLQAELPELKNVIGFELPASDPRSYATICEKGRAAPVAAREPANSDIAGFIYTSGTTGNPKGVILSHGNFASNINAVHELMPLDGQTSLAFLPWAHSFGQTCELHALLSLGSAIAINDEVPNLVANLAEVKPTVLLAVPRIFNRIYDGVNAQMAAKPPVIQKLFRAGLRNATIKNAGGSLGLVDSLVLAVADKIIFSKIRQKFGGRLTYALSGSAALNKDVAEFIDALGIMVYEGYGLSETSPIATSNYPGNRKIGSVGKAIPHVRIVIDKTVTNDPDNGEIVIYGPNVMQGYHHRKEENDAVMMPDGGFRSGDMGRLDAEGYLYITGRIKEQYKLENGKYVVPSPLEEKLKLSPFIANAMIYGENKPFNVALVVPDPEALKRWSAESGNAVADVATDPKVRELIGRELAERSADWKGYDKPRDFVITSEDFTTDNGMLTPTLKLKRRVVLAKHKAALDALYDKPEAKSRAAAN